MRQAVGAFACAMERCLVANAQKGGWSEAECTTEYLKAYLMRELSEYFDAEAGLGLHTSEEELVDIASLCMMLWTRLAGVPIEYQR